jgi:hypothetical protein
VWSKCGVTIDDQKEEEEEIGWKIWSNTVSYPLVIHHGQIIAVIK